jgi:hypothetical protein
VSTARYFVTEQEEYAKNWEMLQRSKKLEADVVRLQDELRAYSLDWSLLGNKSSERDFSYRVNGENIEVLRIDVRETTDQGNPQFKVDSSVSVKHFDLMNIKKLLDDLTESKKELALVKSQLHKLGV